MFVKVAERDNTIPETWHKFHNIMNEVEKINLDVGYPRHRPDGVEIGETAYARLPSFSIDLNLDKSSIYSEFMDEIVVLKNIIQGDVSQFHQSDNLVYLPACYKDAIDICIERWEFTCEVLEDDSFYYDLGFE